MNNDANGDKLVLQPGALRRKHGGARPGAGRKPKSPTVATHIEGGDPSEFLQRVIDDHKSDLRIRIDAAKILLSHSDSKNGIGKKAQQQLAAGEVAGGRFGAQAPPAGAPQLRLIK